MKLSRTANQCAKALVAHIEKETGKDLCLETCLKMTACIQMAINVEMKAQSQKRKPTP